MKFNWFFIILATGILQSCGVSPYEDVDGDDYYEQKFFSNGVKLISPSIDDPRDERSMKQDSYKLNSKARLLARLEKISDRSGRAVVNDEKRMYFAISSDSFIDNQSQYETNIQICPLTTNWMMLATWNQAHPFPDSNGKWKKKGGDYAEEDCVTADLSYPDGREDSLYFDVSDWYVYYVQSHKKNYGLVIKVDGEVEIFGEEDTLRAPRFIWQAR